jgi:hypothetical protein
MGLAVGDDLLCRAGAAIIGFIRSAFDAALMLTAIDLGNRASPLSPLADSPCRLVLGHRRRAPHRHPALIPLCRSSSPACSRVPSREMVLMRTIPPHRHAGTMRTVGDSALYSRRSTAPAGGRQRRAGTSSILRRRARSEWDPLPRQQRSLLRVAVLAGCDHVPPHGPAAANGERRDRASAQFQARGNWWRSLRRCAASTRRSAAARARAFRAQVGVIDLRMKGRSRPRPHTE